MDFFKKAASTYSESQNSNQNNSQSQDQNNQQQQNTAVKGSKPTTENSPSTQQSSDYGDKGEQLHTERN